MAVDFPNAPTNGQQFTSGGTTWVWDGVKWTVSSVAAGGAFLPLAGGTMTGPLVLSGPPTVALNPVSLLFLQDYVIDCGTFP